jgi:hypothetical protein
MDQAVFLSHYIGVVWSSTPEFAAPGGISMPFPSKRLPLRSMKA